MRQLVESGAKWWVKHHVTFKAALLVSVLATALSVWQGASVGQFAPQMLAGATFLAGAMINALLRVWTWADANDAQVSRLTGHIRNEQPIREHLRERFDALERVQTISAAATVLSVALILALIVATVNPPFDADPDPTLIELSVPWINAVATHLAVGLTSAVAMCLFGIVAETVHVGVTSLRGSRTEVGAQSGPNG